MTLVRTNRPFYPSVNSLFNDFFGDQISDSTVSKNVTRPAINVAESNEGYTIEVAAPGFEKSNFNVNVEDNVLTISISKDEEAETKDESKKYVRQEFKHTSFERKFNLPKGQVEEDKIEAQYENGILYVAIPKAEIAKPKPARVISIS